MTNDPNAHDPPGHDTASGLRDDAASALRDVGAFIREQRKLAQLSLRSLAERAGVSNPYLSQIERGLRRPSADILQRVADALRISAETLYVRAGLLEEPRGALDQHIRAAAELTESQKRALLEIYHAFLAGGDRAQNPQQPTASEEES